MNQATNNLVNKILVVDDDELVLKHVRTILTRSQYEVTTCLSAKEALKELQAEPEAFHCVVTDALMPVVSGYEFVQMLRQDPRFEKLPILMLTRKREKPDVKRAVDAGVNDYIVKPIDEHLLLDKIALCLSKSGHRHVFEVPVYSEKPNSQLALPSKIIAVSESGLTVRLAIALTDKTPFQIQSEVFAQIGIETPFLKLLSCELMPEPPGSPEPELPYVTRLSLVGANQTDLRKIRTWLQKETIARRK